MAGAAQRNALARALRSGSLSLVPERVVAIDRVPGETPGVIVVRVEGANYGVDGRKGFPDTPQGHAAAHEYAERLAATQIPPIVDRTGGTDAKRR